MTSAPVRPVRRVRVLVGALAVLVALAAVVALTEVLRHPPTVVPVPEPYDEADPRVAVECPEPPVERRPDEAPVRVSSSDLYACPHVYDGRAVHYEGEVVGALLRRRYGVWAQLNDDAYAGVLGPLPAHREFRGGNAGVGVLLPHEVTNRIGFVGGPNARGDVLGVVGTFHQSDPDTHEVAVIRATLGSVAQRGEPIDHRSLPDRRIAGTLLAAAAGALVAAERLAARRR